MDYNSDKLALVYVIDGKNINYTHMLISSIASYKKFNSDIPTDIIVIVDQECSEFVKTTIKQHHSDIQFLTIDNTKHKKLIQGGWFNVSVLYKLEVFNSKVFPQKYKKVLISDTDVEYISSIKPLLADDYMKEGKFLYVQQDWVHTTRHVDDVGFVKSYEQWKKVIGIQDDEYLAKSSFYVNAGFMLMDYPKLIELSQKTNFYNNCFKLDLTDGSFPYPEQYMIEIGLWKYIEKIDDHGKYFIHYQFGQNSKLDFLKKEASLLADENRNKMAIYYSIYSVSDNVCDSMYWILKLVMNLKFYMENKIYEKIDIVICSDEFTKKLMDEIICQEKVNLIDENMYSKHVKYLLFERVPFSHVGRIWRYIGLTDTRYDLVVSGEADDDMSKYFKFMNCLLDKNYALYCMKYKCYKHDSSILAGNLYAKPKLFPFEFVWSWREFLNQMYSVHNNVYGSQDEFISTFMLHKLNEYANFDFNVAIEIAACIGNQFWGDIDSLSEEVEYLKRKMSRINVSILMNGEQVYKFKTDTDIREYRDNYEKLFSVEGNGGNEQFSHPTLQFWPNGRMYGMKYGEESVYLMDGKKISFRIHGNTSESERNKNVLLYGCPQLDDIFNEHKVIRVIRGFRNDINIESLLKNSFMIHLERDIDRLNLEKAIFKYHNVPFPKIFNGCTDNEGGFKTNANKAHYELIKYAKENKLPYILVLEDDAYIVDGFLDKLKELIKNLPIQSNMTVLGCKMPKIGKDVIDVFDNVIPKLWGSYAVPGYILMSDAYDFVMDKLKHGIDIDCIGEFVYLAKNPLCLMYNFGGSIYGNRSYLLECSDGYKRDFIKGNYTPVETILEAESSREFISKEDIGKYIHPDNIYKIWITGKLKKNKQEVFQMKIPPTLFFIWIGKEEDIRQEYWDNVEDFTQMNPRMNIKFIVDEYENPKHPDVIKCKELCLNDKDSIYYRCFNREWVRNQFNDKVRNNVALQESLRLYLLNKYGGLYLDLDSYPIKPFPIDLFFDKDFVIQSDDHYFIGMRKGYLDDNKEKYMRKSEHSDIFWRLWSDIDNHPIDNNVYYCHYFDRSWVK